MNASSRLAAAALGLLASALVWLAVEGALALARGRAPGQSLAARLLALDPRPLGFDASAGPPPAVLESRAELEALLPAFLSDGIGLGNSPYQELRQPGVNLKVDGPDGCERNLPDQRRVLVQLRTTLFDPLDPLNAFWDPARPLSGEVRAFVSRYGVREVAIETNAAGERRTLPEVDAEREVLVAGDSVAFGVLVGDDETLASELQRRDPTRRYANLGITGIPASTVLCALERGLARRSRAVDAIVYLYCENDFEPGDALASPEPAVERLAALAREHGVSRTLVVYAPYIYNSLPQLTRFAGQRSDRIPTYASERARLREAVRAAGLGWVDFGELVQGEVSRTGTQFAGLSLFVDHAHWSREGVRRAADSVAPWLAARETGAAPR
jgi:lysophospholipase L1-like esterase